MSADGVLSLRTRKSSGTKAICPRCRSRGARQVARHRFNITPGSILYRSLQGTEHSGADTEHSRKSRLPDSSVLNILRMFAGRDASDTPSRRSAGADDVRAHWATIAMW